jgi:hypothetical protein
VIINTDGKRKPGQHWVFALRTAETLEFFDPLGKYDTDDADSSSEEEEDSSRNGDSDIQRRLLRKHSIFWRNRSLLEGITDLVVPHDQYQPSGSENCGLYCVYVAYQRMRRLDQPFSHVLSKIFARDPEENERRVASFQQQLQRQQQHHNEQQ